MSPAAPATRTRARFTTIVLACLTSLVVLAATLATSPPAAAHNALVSADPADGSTVEVAPERVTLTFDDEVILLGSVIEAFGPDGSIVSAGDVQVDGASASQELAGDLPAGEYTVVWRVTSADGHPVEGELRFTATAGTAPSEPEPDGTSAPDAETGPSDDATSDEGTSEPTASAPTPDEQESTAPDDAAPAPGTGSGRAALVVVGVLIAAAAAITFLVRRSARSRQ